MEKTLSRRARQIMEFAQKEAASHGVAHVEPPHLLLGLLHEDRRWPSANIAVHVLEKKDVPIDPLRNEVEAQIVKGMPRPEVEAADIEPDARTQQVFAWADEEAKQLGDMLIGCEHLLMGLLHDPDMGRMLHNISLEEVREAARA
jgi:ATP-dependent Clp protease ATP-binding subunit ClpC